MKSINSTFIIILILMLTACTFSSRSDLADLKRQDVLGVWKISNESSKQLKNGKAESEIITCCQLNDDSTVVVSFGDSMEKKMTGTWIWKAEKRLGNSELGLSLKSDVVIRVNTLSSVIMLWMFVNKTDGVLKLTSNDYTFEKQH